MNASATLTATVPPRTETALEREQRRSDADHRELADVAEEITALTTPVQARMLAFEIAATMILFFGRYSLDGPYDLAMRELRELYQVARAVLWNADKLGEVCARADRLASKYFCTVGPKGFWTAERRIPFELATSLRRACEPEVWRFVPLIIREARWLFGANGGDRMILDDLVRQAVSEAEEARERKRQQEQEQRDEGDTDQ